MNNSFKCSFCNKELKGNKGCLIAHEKCCESNPNFTKQVRSPNAGAKKGSIPWNKGRKFAPEQRWNYKQPLDEVMVKNSSYDRGKLKKRIIDNNLIEYKCAICNSEPVWQGKPMPLILDHINGINNDHRLKNLRFVCSNCDSQLPTYKSKNAKKK